MCLTGLDHRHYCKSLDLVFANNYWKEMSAKLKEVIHLRTSLLGYSSLIICLKSGFLMKKKDRKTDFTLKTVKGSQSKTKQLSYSY